MIVNLTTIILRTILIILYLSYSVTSGRTFFASCGRLLSICEIDCSGLDNVKELYNIYVERIKNQTILPKKLCIFKKQKLI